MRKSIEFDVNDIVNKQFGKLTVVRFSKQERYRNRFNYFYECKCECGKEKLVSKGNLLRGNTRSCGCFLKDSLKKRREGLAPNIRKTPIKLKCLYCEKIFESKYFISKYCDKRCAADNKNAKRRSKLLKVL